MVALPAAELTRERVQGADLLLVRSTVAVGPALLDGSRVRFVATATIGIDHLDTAWLDGRRIRWASAPGSNADSVAQWFAAALLAFAARQGLTLHRRTVGVVGVGNVGSRVARVAEALGCRVLLCDPPRARAEGSEAFVALDELLERSDLVTLHVPLTTLGPDPTRHLLDEGRLGRLRRGGIVINTSRGAVLATAAAAAARRDGQLGGLILDVFEGEPGVDPEIVAACDLATPHIAGHSLDGKANGTLAIYQAACAFLGRKPAWQPRRSLPPPPLRHLSLDARSLDDQAAALTVIRRYYAIEQDDAALRELLRLPVAERGPAFARYRNQYPIRRELTGLRLQMVPPRPRALALLRALGVQTLDPSQFPG